MPLQHSLLWLAALFVSTARPSAGDLIERTVMLRDGTIIRVGLPDQALPWHTTTKDWKVVPRPLRLAEIERLELVRKPLLEKLASVRRLVDRLGHDDYFVREESQRQIMALGPKFHPVLENVLSTTKDPEVRWRLEKILKTIGTLEEGGREATASRDHDLLRRGTSKELSRGELRGWKLSAGYRGEKLPELGREEIFSILDRPPPAESRLRLPLGGWQRIAEDRDEHFPKDLIRIGFERGPEGEELVVGRDLRDTFVPLGVQLVSRSANPDSFISVQRYNVRGRSGGYCAATHDPLYQGEIRIRFCMPGSPHVAAGVHYVGFWTAHVAPGGTILEAYDAAGRRLAAVATVKHQRDFLALRSEAPIAMVRVVADPDVDRDFAIDDLFFDPPKILPAAPAKDRYTVLLKSGERLPAKSLKTEGEKLALSGTSLRKGPLAIPRDEVAAVVSPRAQTREEIDQPACFVLLQDGSIIRVLGGEKPAPLRFDKLKFEPSQAVACWGVKSIPLPRPEEDMPIPDGGGVLVQPGKQKVFGGYAWGTAWITSDDLPPAAFPFSYAKSPTLWFAARPKLDDSGAQLLLKTGEQLVLKHDGRFSLVDWDPKQITVKADGTEYKIPLSDVQTLVLPQKSVK